VAERTIDVTDEPAGYDEAGPVLLRGTAPDALSNLVAVLELAADRQLSCGATTRSPSAATVKLVADVLVAGDYYDGGEPIAAAAWPVLLQVGGLANQARADAAWRGDAGRAVLPGAERPVDEMAGVRLAR